MYRRFASPDQVVDREGRVALVGDPATVELLPQGLGRIGAGMFQFSDGFGGADVSGDNKTLRQVLLNMLYHFYHRIGVTVCDINRDVIGRQPFFGKLPDEGVFSFFDTHTDRSDESTCFHIFNKITPRFRCKTVHDIKVSVLGEEYSNFFIDNRLHIGRHHRQFKGMWPKSYASIAFRTAVDYTFGRN
jgi:hypothetical protein